MIKPAWYHWAMARQGLAEIPGPGSNPQVVDLWKLGKVKLKVNDDDVPWCAAFANAALEETGYRGTQSGMARSFQPSQLFKVCEPHLGAIVVLSSSRGPSSGHVGFLHAQSDEQVYLIGGNQGDKVVLAPFDKKKVLHYLWPASAPSADLFPVPFEAVNGVFVSDR